MFADRGIILTLFECVFITVEGWLFYIDNVDDDFKGEEVIEIVQSIPTPFAHIHNPTPSNDKLHRISVISHNEDEDTSERWKINSRVMWNGILNNYKSPSDDTKSSENKIFYSYNKPQKKQKSEKVEPKLINSQKPWKLSLQDKESIASTQDSEYFHINCQNSASECDTGKGIVNIDVIINEQS